MSPWYVPRVQEGSGPPREASNKTDSLDPLAFGLLAIMVAGVLAMIGTWFLVQHSPIPGDEAIELGVLGFLFVLFVDLSLVYRLAGPAFRSGRRKEAVQRSVVLLLLGLLAASLAGVSPWSLSWLVTHYPWILSLPDFSWLVWLVTLPYSLWIWKRGRRSS